MPNSIRSHAFVAVLLLLPNADALAQIAPSAYPKQQLQLPNPSDGLLAATVYATLYLPDGKVPVGNDFRKIASVQARGVARISHAALVSVRTFDAGRSSRSYGVSAMQAAGSTPYIRGTFVRAVAPNGNYLNRADIKGGLQDADWQPSPNGSVEALALDGSMVYVGGSFANAIPAPGGNRLIRIRPRATVRSTTHETRRQMTPC